MHTLYIGEAPEHGKSTFFQRLENEIRQIKKQYPDALYLGISDGAKNNWTFLEQYTDRQLLDFFHVTEYLANVSYAAYPGKTDKPKQEKWLHERYLSSNTKPIPNTVEDLISEMEKFSRKTSLTKTVKENLLAALTYFVNHRNMMDYATHSEQNLPIGSGVTESRL